jgi:hypothetical protein
VCSQRFLLFTGGAPRRVVVPVRRSTARCVDVDGAVLLVADGRLGDGLLRALARDTRSHLVLAGSGRRILRGARVVVVAAVRDRAARVAVAGVASNRAPVRELRTGGGADARRGQMESRGHARYTRHCVATIGAHPEARLPVLPAGFAVLVGHGAPACFRLDGGALARDVAGHRPVPRRDVLVDRIARWRVDDLRAASAEREQR